MGYRGAAVLPLDPRGRTLILRRAQGPEPGTWGPPGGFLEAGETPLQAALREFHEESGYVGPFQVGRSWENRPGKARSRTYPLRVRHFRPTLSSEHDAWAWVRPRRLNRYPLYSAFRNGLRNVVGAHEDLAAYASTYEDPPHRWSAREPGGPRDWSNYYPRSARGDDLTYVGEKVHWGRNVGWPGTPREMVPVDPDYAFPIEGNLFDWDKLASVAEGIRSAPGRVTLRPGYGEFFVVDRGDIAESLEYAEDSTLGRPYSTGDEELDAYLIDPEDAISDRDFLAVGERGYKTAVARFEKELRQAERNQDGDFGELAVQVRDGNHRTFGAILAGEPVVWVRISSNQLQSLDEPDSQWKGIRALRKKFNWKAKRRGRGHRARRRGRSLPETGYSLSVVSIYRAVPGGVSTIKPMDYVTRTQKWAEGHADHVAAVEEEESIVLKAMVKSAHVYEASNPGEYFYDGPAVRGRVVYRSQP